MNSQALLRFLVDQDAGAFYVELAEALSAELPKDADFESDQWDVMSWATRPKRRRTMLLDYSCIAHSELRCVAKVWILDGRLKDRIGVHSAGGRVTGIASIASVLGSRPLSTLCTEDFYVAERKLASKFGGGTAYRRAGFLQSASKWLSKVFGLRLDYLNKLANPAVHGAYGTEDGRSEKLIHLQVLADLLRARNRPDLSAKDQFFLSVVAINVGAGLRVGEMTALPADCILREGRGVQLRLFAEKHGKPVARPIDPLIVDVVTDAVDHLRAFTKPGRRAAKAALKDLRVDWNAIASDAAAFRYFTAKWAADWTSRPENQMFNRDGAWYQSQGRFVDAIGALEAANGSKRRAAINLGVDRNTFYGLLSAQLAATRGELPVVRRRERQGAKRVNWDGDSRVISLVKLKAHAGVHFHSSTCFAVKDIIDRAQELQLQGIEFEGPTLDAEFEARFRRGETPVVRRQDGRTVLAAHEALLVVEKYALSEARSTREGEFVLITDRDISGWLAGEARSRGTANHEDSVFRRLGITDPKTGEIASFTWHDIRHWLDTAYENGGFTRDQIALLFNRSASSQNATYDQTSKRTRTDRVVQGIKEKMVVGPVSTVYHGLADLSREQADRYLEAAVRVLNPMPHGLCSLDWAKVPCPHQLSCFKHDAGDDGPCEHLVIDARDRLQVDGLLATNRTAGLQLAMLIEQLQVLGVDNSPQIAHFKAVSANTAKLIAEIDFLEEGRDGQD